MNVRAGRRLHSEALSIDFLSRGSPDGFPRLPTMVAQGASRAPRPRAGIASKRQRCRKSLFREELFFRSWLRTDLQSPEIDFRLSPNRRHSSLTSVSDRGLEANSCWKYAESIIVRGYFDGLFLHGVAPAGHRNGSRDDGGSLAVGRPLGNGHWNATSAHDMATQCAAGIGTPVSPGHLVETGKVSFAPKGAGGVACEITKPCRLWDGGSVSGRMKSLAAWLAPQAAKSPDSYGCYRKGSVLVITIQSIRTPMGLLIGISPADTWQARWRPRGALHYGEVRAKSTADAYLALT